MKPFVSVLMQQFAKPRPNTYVPAPASLGGTRDEVEGRYITLLKDGDMSTLEIATALNSLPVHVLKQLRRAEKRGILKEVGTEPSTGSRRTIVWSLV